VNPRLTAEDMGYIGDVIRAASRNELPSA
jgi:hypothetical protein